MTHYTNDSEVIDAEIVSETTETPKEDAPKTITLSDVVNMFNESREYIDSSLVGCSKHLQIMTQCASILFENLKGFVLPAGSEDATTEELKEESAPTDNN